MNSSPIPTIDYLRCIMYMYTMSLNVNIQCYMTMLLIYCNYFFNLRFNMSPFNPISTILGQNKLEGSNYIDWRRNLDIVLTAEEYKFVLNEECPLKPNDQSSDEDKLAYQKWRKADEMTRCYIMASMSNVLQHQHQAMLSAFEILENLKQMFGD